MQNKRKSALGRNGKNKRWLPVIAPAFMAALALGLQTAARLVPGFGEWYAAAVYPVIVGTAGRLFGAAPFSVAEAGLYLLALLAVAYIVLNIRKGKRLAVGGAYLIAAALLLFTLNCGINYYRTPFSDYLDLEVRESPPEELYSLCLKLTERANALRERTDGAMPLKGLGREGRAAMKRLGETYPQLSGYYPQPKPLVVSKLLSVQQLCGFYSPFTVEANYNRDMPGYNIPHTICHELSHLKGFMREDEANFIGYLACISSDSAQYQYSGYLRGWEYAANALVKVDAKAYTELWKKLSPEVLGDLQYNNSFWAEFEGPAAEVSNKINDTYLKINSQQDGVRSYGRAVDLMLAYERRLNTAN